MTGASPSTTTTTASAGGGTVTQVAGRSRPLSYSEKLALMTGGGPGAAAGQTAPPAAAAPSGGATTATTTAPTALAEPKAAGAAAAATTATPAAPPPVSRALVAEVEAAEAEVAALQREVEALEASRVAAFASIDPTGALPLPVGPGGARVSRGRTYTVEAAAAPHGGLAVTPVAHDGRQQHAGVRGARSSANRPQFAGSDTALSVHVNYYPALVDAKRRLTEALAREAALERDAAALDAEIPRILLELDMLEVAELCFLEEIQYQREELDTMTLELALNRQGGSDRLDKGRIAELTEQYNYLALKVKQKNEARASTAPADGSGGGDAGAGAGAGGGGGGGGGGAGSSASSPGPAASETPTKKKWFGR
jgi:hypothetical protein